MNSQRPVRFHARQKGHRHDTAAFVRVGDLSTAPGCRVIGRRTRDQETDTNGPDCARHDLVVDKRNSVWRRALAGAIIVVLIALTVYLWPAMLGGQTRLVVVSGRSMEPTYDLRDIVVVREAGDAEVGDVVVFQVPDGEAEGLLFIHRVLAVDDDGLLTTQGDNRTTPDQWRLTENDLIGEPLARIPNGGAALGFIQNTWVIALLIVLVALLLFWPDSDDDDDDHEVEEDDDEALAVTWATSTTESETGSRRRAIDPDAEPGEATADALAERWLDSEMQHAIESDVMADAMAWLDRQLEGVERPVDH